MIVWEDGGDDPELDSAGKRYKGPRADGKSLRVRGWQEERCKRSRARGHRIA
jgi:hypothetical protein